MSRKPTIPILLQVRQADAHASIFGRDYDTPDGTCIRDYIHVLDLCQRICARWTGCSVTGRARHSMWATATGSRCSK